VADVNKATAIILILISVLFLAALIPTIIDNIQDSDKGSPYAFNQSGENETAIWWNFTGYSGAATLWLLIPLLIIAGAALGFVKDLI